jgi:hypothetical protein
MPVQRIVRFQVITLVSGQDQAGSLTKLTPGMKLLSHNGQSKSRSAGPGLFAPQGVSYFPRCAGKKFAC